MCLKWLDVDFGVFVCVRVGCGWNRVLLGLFGVR